MKLESIDDGRSYLVLNAYYCQDGNDDDSHADDSHDDDSHDDDSHHESYDDENNEKEFCKYDDR